jgi:hypothetical protein
VVRLAERCAKLLSTNRLGIDFYLTGKIDFFLVNGILPEQKMNSVIALTRNMTPVVAGTRWKIHVVAETRI